MGGTGQFAAGTTKHARSFDISNNTIVSSGVQAMEVFMQETQGQTILREGCVLRNNLQVCTAAIPQNDGFALTAGGISTPVYIDADYNFRWNMSGAWFRGHIQNTNAGLHNADTIDPQFVDPTREIEKWGKLVTNNPNADYKAVWNILLQRNGLGASATSMAQDSINIPAIGFADLFTWLQAGYAPQNIMLAQAGEGGTYVGALPPGEMKSPRGA
jgi:hypothetical protein